MATENAIQAMFGFPKAGYVAIEWPTIQPMFCFPKAEYVAIE